jgi:glycosyltransferase involved in cell wall biosynthesis
VVTKEKFRVLVLADASSFHTERYVGELLRQDVEVLLVSLEEGRIPHHRLAQRTPFSPFWYAMAATEVRSIIRDFKPDVLNPHFASGYGFTVALANARKTTPVALHLWGSDILVVPAKSIFHARKTAHALRHADLVIGDSEYLIKEASELATLKEKLVVPWGIEREYLKLGANRKPMKRPLKIIIPRHHEKIYNNLFLAQALAPLVNAGHIELTFPSFGSLSGDFRLKTELLLGDAIHYYDPMNRPQFLEFMAGHDIYLSSAITDSSPVSLIEAMGLGLIPVVADIPGVKEWLDDQSGFPYPLYDGAALQKIIGDLLKASSNHDDLRKHNERRVEREALFENNVATMIEAMKRLRNRGSA